MRTFLCLCLMFATSLQASTFRLEPRVGYRHDDLSQAFHLAEEVKVDFDLSNLHMIEAGLYLALNPGRIWLEGQGSFGAVLDGDIDQFEIEDATGGAMDFQASVGLQMGCWIPKVGVSGHVLIIDADIWTFDADQDIRSTDLDFVTAWHSVWVGLTYPCGCFEVSGRFHLGQHYADTDLVLGDFDITKEWTKAYGAEVEARATVPVFNHVALAGTATGRYWWNASDSWKNASWRSFSVAVGIVIH